MKDYNNISTKIYKPEILNCAKCNTKLKYCYAVSNRIINFSNGRIIRIKNLGYKCPKCNDNVYFSLAANKFAYKGYTYSFKIMCMIDYYMNKGYGREKLCDMFYSKGIEISDRNINMIHNKFKTLLNMDYDKNINDAYNHMLAEFGEIRLAIDHIIVNDKNYVMIYDFFSGKLIALWNFNGVDDINMYNMLSNYLKNDNIKVIITVRPNIKFCILLKTITSKTVKYYSFAKF